MSTWSRSVLIKSALPQEVALSRIGTLIDRDPASRSRLEWIRHRTTFGSVRGSRICLEVLGPFGSGFSGQGGWGFWQPIFDGHLRASEHGSTLVGQIRRPWAYYAFVGAGLLWFLTFLYVALLLLFEGARPNPLGAGVMSALGVAPLLMLLLLTRQAGAEDAELIDRLGEAMDAREVIADGHAYRSPS